MRDSWRKLLGRAAPTNLEDVIVALPPVSDAPYAMDPSFWWELKFMADVAGSASELCVERQLLKRFPTEGRSAALQDYLLGVAKFQLDDAFVFSQKSTDKVECVKEVVQGMLSGTSPNAAVIMRTGRFYEHLMQGMKFFLRVELPGAHDAVGITLTGPKALAHLLDETAARFEAEPYPAFDELQVFSTFKWMMDEAQKKQLTTWVGAIFASGTKDSDHAYM